MGRKSSSATRRNLLTENRTSLNPHSPTVFGQGRKQPKIFRVSPYTRVSNDDQQMLPTQGRALREHAARLGYACRVRLSGGNHRLCTTTLLFLAVFAVPANSQGQMTRSEKLASNGQIQENAPVKASSEIVIHASAETVWRLLTNIDEWPTWQSTISSAKINGPLEPGTTFVWTSGRSKIKSRVVVVHPVTQLVWTGVTFGATAIHVWNLQSIPDGGTLVKTTESMDGFMLKVFYSSKDLAMSHKIWLDALKRKAEQ